MSLLRTYWWGGNSWDNTLYRLSKSNWQILSQVKPNDPDLAAAQLTILKIFGDHPTIIIRRKDNGTDR